MLHSTLVLYLLALMLELLTSTSVAAIRPSDPLVLWLVLPALMMLEVDMLPLESALKPRPI